MSGKYTPIGLKILGLCAFTLVLVGLVTFLVYSYSLNAAAERRQLSVARAFFQQIVITRTWTARHGGVYVPLTESVERNPYLDDIPGIVTDIEDTEGRQYTLRNPALITREISMAAEEQGIFQFHITSLDPLNPANAPSDFERRALEAFERGSDDLWEYSEEGDQSTFWYMAPIHV